MFEMLACLEFKRMDILGRVVRVVVEKWRVNGEGQSDVGVASGGADRIRQRYLIVCMLLKKKMPYGVMPCGMPPSVGHVSADA